jgi:two-component system response regulator ChvI
MPEMNGLEVLQALRQDGIATPTIFLTGVSDDAHEEAALSSGAVDYVDKSRISSTLVKRIELIAARQKSLPAPEQQQNEVRLGGLTLRLDAHRALWQGALIDLTHTEFRMVSRLALKAGEDVSYRELYDLVHGKGFVAGCGELGYRTNVRTFIKRIRQKFRATDPSFACIENYGGFGYRWAVR